MHNEMLSITAIVRLQSRPFVCWNQSLRHNPSSNPALLRLSAMISEHFQQLSGSDRNAHERLTSNGLKSAFFLAYRHPLLSNICVMPRPTSIAYRCSRWPGFCIGFRDQRGEKTMGVLWNPDQRRFVPLCRLRLSVAPLCPARSNPA